MWMAGQSQWVRIASLKAGLVRQPIEFYCTRLE
jgi:hypothetical protein